VVVAGGVIPPADYDFLYEAGVKCIFGPGTKARHVACLLRQSSVRLQESCGGSQQQLRQAIDRFGGGRKRMHAAAVNDALFEAGRQTAKRWTDAPNALPCNPVRMCLRRCHR
jgi:hypothetical protein